MSYPLPPKLLLSSVNPSTFAHCAMLLIRVEEVPRPQFRGKSNVVLTFSPLLVFRKSGFKFLASRRIFDKVIAYLLSGFEGVKSSKLKNSSNQANPSSSRLVHCSSSCSKTLI